LAGIYRKDLAKPDEAVALLEEAINQGDGVACNSLASEYAEGTIVTKSYTRAVELYTQGASFGLPAAMWNAAIMYWRGSEDVPQDMAKARYWMTQVRYTFPRFVFFFYSLPFSLIHWPFFY
jgi:TPR repeat protein